MKRDIASRQASAPCKCMATNVQIACLCFLVFFISLSAMLAYKGELHKPGPVQAGKTMPVWLRRDLDEFGSGKSNAGPLDRPFTSTVYAFRKWDAEVGCETYRAKLAPVNRTTFLQDPNPVSCSDLRQTHVSILVKERDWIPDNLNNLYACSCGLSCLWGTSPVLVDDPDANFFETHKPPGKRRKGDPLRIYIELEPHKRSSSQDIFVSYHHSDDLQATYAGASFHVNRNYFISTRKNQDILVYWSSSRCVKLRQDIAKEFLALVPHHSFGKCLNNLGGRDTIDNMYPRCRNSGGKSGWSSNLHCAMSHYKFVLAIENTFTESYVTEKLFYALDAGSIPIYFGAPNVMELVPPNSIIQASDFGSLKQLAAFVKHVANDPVLYAGYHAWRRCGELGNYVQTRAVSLDSLPCRLCAVVSRLGGKTAPDPV